MKRYVLLCLMILCSLVAFGTPRTALYVSATGSDTTGDGSACAPWATIQRAAAAVKAGEVVFVGPGQYSGAITTSASGTACNPIVFQAAPGVTIAGRWRLVGEYVTITGFAMQGPLAGSLNFFDLSGAKHCTVSYNTVQGGDYNDRGVYLGGSASSYNAIEHNVIRNIDYVPIWIGGVGNTIERNTVDNVSTDAILVWGHGHVIRGNDVGRVTYAPNHADYMQTFSNAGDTNESYDILVERNFFHDSPWTTEPANVQIGQLSPQGNPNIRDWMFRNNIFARIDGPLNINIPGTKVLNNLFYRVSTRIGGNAVNFGDSVTNGPAHNPTVKNNLFIGCGRLMDKYGSYSMEAGVQGDDCSHNLVADGPPGYGPKKLTLSRDLAGASLNGINPLFVDELGGDFRLLPESPVVSAGVNLSLLFKDDFDGSPRPATGPWSIGPFAAPRVLAGMIAARR